MLYNGLALVIDRALGEVGDPTLFRYRDALVLGSLREDMWYVAPLRRASLSTALSHFYGPPWPGGLIPFLTPGTPGRVERLFRRSLRQARPAEAMTLLGRATHLLIDMACPVHVHRCIHDRDPYEEFVESHVAELALLPAVPLSRHCATAAELVKSLARITRETRPAQDWVEANCQAETLIPAAVAHVTALFHLFMSRATLTFRQPTATAGPPVGAVT